MRYELPYPPSVNHYWNRRKGGRGMYISAAGVAFRASVASAVQLAGPADPLCGPLVVVAQAFPPDRRKRDLDNLWKALLDALAHAGAYADDSQIVDERIYWGPRVPGGRVVVDVDEVGE